MQRQNVKYDELEAGSGVLRATFKAWRRKNRPGLENLEAALGYLGWDFVPLPRSEAIPEEILRELRPLAGRLNIEMVDAVRLIAEIAAKDQHLLSLQSGRLH